ncbi:Maf family protein [Aeromonas schubertii]|uniref:Maf family protein n=1 Tax=Aeromonas schubertii TaxID=652 RepID=UPI0010A849DD|nr:Maf family protein [Aeromonas schubertii]QCG48141.1 septum formation inhibitor Maf [Aeromonas schubertii]
MPEKVILASTSRYRAALLAKLGMAFDTEAPRVDETPLPGETAPELVLRLAINKAQAVADGRDHGLVIGSDQVCVCDGRILGKPGNFDNALAQLKAAQGSRVIFYTGLCVINAVSGEHHSLVEPFTVHFRTLDEAAITRYLLAETPYDCAGSFKSEGMGITLFSALEGRDPNALIGLPLIGLVELFKRHGLALP